MDTDDLSKEAYKATIAMANRFHEDLALQFGLLSYDCADEEEYLIKCQKLIRELKRLKRANLSDVFFEKEPDINDLKNVLDQISESIAQVKRVDFNKRNFDEG